jgi:hypothetical protein
MRAPRDREAALHGELLEDELVPRVYPAQPLVIGEAFADGADGGRTGVFDPRLDPPELCRPELLAPRAHHRCHRRHGVVRGGCTERRACTQLAAGQRIQPSRNPDAEIGALDPVHGHGQ